MARKLLVKSVAEGVETQQDWDALKAVGCDTVQGYFIAQPMDKNTFGDFAENYKQSFAKLMQSAAPQSAQKQNKLAILVVEDDDFTRKIILRILHDLGYSNLTGVNSAVSAIKLFETNAFDLIITDVNMPEMNGLKFIQMIRAGKTHAKPDTRIVVLTSFSQSEILGTALVLDVNGFLVKPIIPAVVEEKLTQAISEPLHLHSRMAYETVKTEFHNLPHLEEQQSPIHLNPSTTINNHPTRHSRTNMNTHHLALRRLRPGMMLKENVHLKDGTLILSSGHALSELSINRLKDLEALLPSEGVAVQEIL